MSGVFVYWDNSNIFISAQEVAAEREGETARSRVRIHSRNLLKLVRREWEIERATAGGSIPPELRGVWNRLENEGGEIALLERGSLHGREQGVDQLLQTQMLRDSTSRLRPLTFLPVSKPRGPPLSVAFTDWLSTTPADGLARRPCALRASSIRR